MKLEMQMQVAENIRYLRNIFRYTQTQVADGIHICRSSYALYELGRKVPGADTIIDLADFYNVRVDTILQPDRDKFVKDIFFSDKYKDQLLTLVEIFYQLSPYAQGCLIERARVLLEGEQSGDMSKFNPTA